MMKKLISVAAVMGLLVGCGGSTVSGTVRGAQLSAQDAVFDVINSSSGGGQTFVLYIGDTPNLCQKIKANQTAKNSASFVVVAGVVDNAGNTGALANGDYTVYPFSEADATGKVAFTVFDKYDGTCRSTLGSNTPTGTGGKVTLNSFSAKEGGTASGTFEVFFGADKVTGNFNATYCSFPTSSGTSTCI
ncbi:MAG TPA: hypothetical protein VK447_16355 [Myxococcaceae bacterium]|nr:hypothetical protein [Myxococcaceae bacterium]